MMAQDDVFTYDPAFDEMMENVYENRRRLAAEIEAEIRAEERAPLHAAMAATGVSSSLTANKGATTMTQQIQSRGETPRSDDQDIGVIPNHPLAKIIGVFKDNPVLDDVMEEIYEMRRRQIAEVEAEIRSEERKTQTGITE